MGTVYTDITLKNVKDIVLAEEGRLKAKDVREVTVNAVVGAVQSWPGHLE